VVVPGGGAGGVKKQLVLALLLAGGALASVAFAAASAQIIETYRYDARGRLIRVERSNPATSNTTSNYTYDKADNRTSKTVTGAPK
jgi:hypothetical protein